MKNYKIKKNTQKRECFIMETKLIQSVKIPLRLFKLRIPPKNVEFK